MTQAEFESATFGFGDGTKRHETVEIHTAIHTVTGYPGSADRRPKLAGRSAAQAARRGPAGARQLQRLRQPGL